ASKPLLASMRGARFSRLGRRVPHPRAEPLALLAFGLPPPHDRLDDDRRLDLPAHTHVSAALVRRRDWLRGDVPRPGRLPLRRSRRGGDLRPPLAGRGGTAPM